MAHDVFVSYSTQDKPTADAMVASLEANGIRCWIAPRDILPGTDWGEAIVEAIEAAGTMVLVFSAHSNTSPQIRREIERAVDTGIPLIPVRIEDVLPCRSLQYFIGPQHWLDAWAPPLEQHLLRLTDTITALLSRRLERFDAAGREPRLKPHPDTAAGTPPTAAEPLPDTTGAKTPAGIPPGPPPRRFAWTLPLTLAGFLVAAALGGGAVWWLIYQPAPQQSARTPSLPPKEAAPRAEQPKAPAKPAVTEMTAEYYFNKGQEANDPQEKIMFYNQAINLNPKYAPAFNYRGNAYFTKKYYDLALEDYNTAISLDQSYAYPYNNRGLYYLEKKEYERALQDFDTAIILAPKDARFYSHRGVAYLNKKDFKNALKDLNKSIELSKKSPIASMAYYNRSILYYQKKEYGKALHDLNQTIELDKNHKSAYRSRGKVYFYRKEYDKALQDFSKDIELNPSDAFSYKARGIIYYIQNKYTQALQNYDQALELNPDDQDLYERRKKLSKQIR
jgi:tetratricopeptide (TPR) repeat protein